ncbi:amidohydrolase [Amycolatopsis thermalba]|uniref:Amidohydrolase n=1 Tax=Amycolatopsis thermalba TaxID=944492 RepID=A0ABY4NUE8_9PSEU|nr:MULTISPECIES: amidohydrolase [Amycolatopsis]OXM72898.1 amidohydrolase [Amycolatopsis sp. KNN50.9b]UQS23684.1 amidohydrolase [Amycolatopsis thermalba]
MSTTVFRNGAVFCADAARSVASAVAVRDGVIVAVGGDAEVASIRAGDVVDLHGRLLLPGFVDAHVHPVMGGLERLRCDLSGLATADEYLAAIGGYAAAHPDRAWILGGGWSMSAFPRGCPTAAVLDRTVPDRPVFLPNRDHHSAWVNTPALELAGISADTPDPADGRIERDEHGLPTGTLHEGAMALVERLVPAPAQADFDAGLREAQRHLHSLGVVGWQDALVEVDGPGASVHAAYLRAQREGTLTARVTGALWWDRACPPDGVADQVAALVKLREETARLGGRYDVGTVKVMLDGVAETFTAAMLEPYLDRCGHPTGNRGLSFLDAELAKAVTIALDAAGFQVHFHALGDRAVRDALDAIAAARAANGSSGRRHQLAHLQVVHPDDVPRFRRLGATANLQALWATHEPQMDELTIPFLGDERAARQYPFGDLFRGGATLAMGSDWPVSSPDPLAAVHVAVNRVGYDAPAGTPPLGAHQALPLPVALAAYTAGSAWVSRVDTGTIAVGRPADLVVLDRDPFDGPVGEIGAARVARTYIDGRLVHDER